jgi:MFS family permease
MTAPRGQPSNRARVAAVAVFFLTGTSTATWAARIPAVQHDLGLSAGDLALAILGLEGGAIAGLPAGGAWATRLGSRATLRIGFALYPVALLAVAAAPTLAALAAALGLMAFATSLNDVAMNAQGVELERRARRPVMSGLHAGHSFGVLAGGLAGTAAAAIGLDVLSHFAVIAAAGLLLGQLATTALVRDGGHGRAGRPRGGLRALARGDRRLVLLGGIAFCAFLLDGAAYAWIAVHLSSEREASAAVAAAGFAAFALAVASGRLAGDRLVARRGRVAVVRGAAVLVAAGCGVALAAPWPWLALAGWAVFGLGVAPLAPTILAAAPRVSAVPAPVAIAAVTAVGYLGSFTGPPVVGALAGPVGLTAALLVLAAAAGVAFVLGGFALRERTALLSAARASSAARTPPRRRTR